MTHDELVELIPFVAIDAVSDAERNEARAHIAGCPSCAARMAEYEQVAAALLKGTPTTTLPAQLETQLRGRVRALQAASAPPRGFLPRMFALPRWAVAGLSALLVALSLAIWVLGSPPPNTEPDAATVLRSPDAKHVGLKGTELAPNSRGQVIILPNAASVYLEVNDLAALSPQQTYQVWLTRNGERDSAGMFAVNKNGWALFRLQTPRPLNTYQEIGVSVEPAGGSPWPTTSRVIGGPLR